MSGPEQENDREQGDGEAANRISGLVDRYGDSPFSAPIVLICLFANLLLWLLLIASPSTVAWTIDRLTASSSSEGNSRGGVLLIMAVPFILPFIAVYSVARNRHPDIEDESSIETGMMAGYAYRQRSDKRWKIWLLSGMAGGLNCVLLLAVYIFRR